MKAISLILITALTMGLTQPAQAQQRSHGLTAEQLVVGLLGLAIVGNVIHNKRENRREAEATERRYTQTTRPARNKVVPARCLRRHQTRHGQVKMFALRCLERSDVNVNRLPDRCFAKVRTVENQRRRGFRARCMRRAGYVVR
ncbi:MAG: hypothetical protein ACPG5U_03070 [Planktomarina sp.]